MKLGYFDPERNGGIAFSRFLRLLVVAFLASVLAACGGGGGGDDSSEGSTGGGSTGGGSTGGGSTGGEAIPEAMPDTSFGDGNGRVIHSAPIGYTFRPADSVIMADGRIVVAGSMYIPSMPDTRMAVWMLDPDGSLDTGFGKDYNGDGTRDGYVLSANSGVGKAIAATAGGTLFVAGEIEVSGRKEIRVWALDSLGNDSLLFSNKTESIYDIPDPDSDGDGQPEGDAGVNDIFIDSANRPVLVGYGSRADLNRNMAMWRFVGNPFTGAVAIAPTFGQNGVLASAGTSAGDEEAYAIEQDADGFYIVAGETYDGVSTSSMQDMVLWRVNSSGGNFDANFPYPGGGGVYLHDNAAGGNGGDGANALAITDDGSIFIGGYSANLSVGFDGVIWKLTKKTDGTWDLDNNYGANNGYTLLPGPSNITQSVARLMPSSDGTGALLASGTRGIINEEGGVTWSLDASGQISKQSLFSFNGQNDFYESVGIYEDSNNRVISVFGVETADPQNTGLAMLRYLP